MIIHDNIHISEKHIQAFRIDGFNIAFFMPGNHIIELKHLSNKDTTKIHSKLKKLFSENWFNFDGLYINLEKIAYAEDNLTIEIYFADSAEPLTMDTYSPKTADKFFEALGCI